MRYVYISNNYYRLKIEKDNALGHYLHVYSYEDDTSMICDLTINDLKKLHQELGQYLEVFESLSAVS